MFYVDKETEAIYLTRGDDAALDVTLKDASGSAYTMQAGDTLTLTVRRTPADADVVLTVTSGSTRLLISHDDTATAQVGAYSADIQLLSGGQRLTIWPALDGRARSTEANFKNFVLMPEVTRV